MRLIVVVFLVVHCFNVNASDCKGCVPLDVYSFDKVISKFEASVVKFDVAYPYGNLHDEFIKAAESCVNITNLLIGEVGVKDYGDKENSELAERFKIKKEDFPVIRLFLSNAKEPLSFNNKEFTATDIIKFIRKNSGIHIGLPGCLKDFDLLALKFAETTDIDKQKAFLKEAEDLWNGTEEQSDKKKAEMYVKIMKKSLEKGKDFISNELDRVQNLVKEKFSTQKKAEMLQRVNILQSFLHDEL